MELRSKNPMISLPNTKIDSSCIHARQLIALVDADKNDQRLQFFKKHSKECHVCQKQLKELEKSLLRLEYHIPKPVASLEMKNEFQNELSQLLSNVGLSPQAKLKAKKIKLFSTLNDVNRDMELVLRQKKYVFFTIIILGFFAAYLINR